MNNPFTKRSVPQEFEDLSYNISLSLTIHDEPYFAIRSQTEKITIASDGLKGNPFEKITTDPVFAKISISEENRANIMRELDFLQLFKLVVEQNDEFYVHQNAHVFYDRNTGLFVEKPNSIPNTEPFKDLLRSYTLPGRFWAAYYPRLYLPDTIELSNRLDTEMIEVEEEMMDLDDHDFTLPKIEKQK
jgi:hypothetical protein